MLRVLGAQVCLTSHVCSSKQHARAPQAQWQTFEHRMTCSKPPNRGMVMQTCGLQASLCEAATNKHVRAQVRLDLEIQCGGKVLLL